MTNNKKIYEIKLDVRNLSLTKTERNIITEGLCREFSQYDNDQIYEHYTYPHNIYYAQTFDKESSISLTKKILELVEQDHTEYSNKRMEELNDKSERIQQFIKENNE